MNNPIQMIKNIMSKITPQQMIQRIAGNNPMINNLIQKAQEGDTKSVENFARNLLKEQGKDFDSEFNKFMSNFK